MIAGQLALLEEPADEPLEDWMHDSSLPALSVERTQQSLEGVPVQQGKVAGRKETVREDISAGRLHDSDGVFIDVDRVEGLTQIATEWVADVTNSGIILAASTEGDGLSFPFDVFWARTGNEPSQQQINVSELHTAWAAEDTLGDVWMVGSESGEGSSITYHDAASETETPTIGLGFRRPFDGRGFRGVIYESGYVALYSCGTAELGVKFIAEELLPFAFVGDGDDGTQSTLPEAGDSEVSA